MMMFPEPQYLAGMTDEDKAIATARFLIRLAALYHSPEGKMQYLSRDIGLHPNNLATATTISPETAIKLEKCLGRERFPRELFRPDLFVIEE